MKTKRIITSILSTVVCLSVLSACGSETKTQSSSTEQQSKQESAQESTQESKKSDNSEQSSADETSEQQSVAPETSEYTLTIKDTGKNDEITATFVNTMTDESEDVKMEKTGEGDDYFIYTCKGDTDKYNVFHLSCGDRVTKDAAFNKYISGWKHFEGELVPYDINSDKELEIKYDTKTFKFNDLDKNVYIWTPEDYDADSDEKYSTIYMLDGQTVLSNEISGSLRSWNVAEHTDAMMSATDNKAILVCIEAGEMRDEEYSPVLSKDAKCLACREPCGDVFADFICDTIMPYVQENYNVYTDAKHTSIAGSSMGGLECFFIGMEHGDKFGTAGVFSPSFWAYGEDDWKAYLSSKTYGDDCALLYFYSGSFGSDTGSMAEPLYNGVIEAGYPKDKLIFSKNEKGEHKEECWSNIYPEFLEAAFSGKVSALESGTPVKYTDRTPPENMEEVMQAEESTGEPDTRPDYVKNYIFFDNSEMKWDKVCVYWFGVTRESPVNKATGEEEYGSPVWPGIEMEKIEGTEIYRAAAPLGVSNIIFSNGVLDVDVKDGATAYQTEDLVYSDAAFSGRVYKIDTSVPANQGAGYEKTKFKYPSGSWTDYEGEDHTKGD